MRKHNVVIARDGSELGDYKSYAEAESVAIEKDALSIRSFDDDGNGIERRVDDLRRFRDRFRSARNSAAE